MSLDVQKIREIAGESEVHTRFFEWLAGRQKHSAETSVDYGMRIVRGASRADIIKMYRALDEVGLGRFLIGRRGGESRMLWYVNLADLGQVYEGSLDELDLLAEFDDEEEKEEFDYPSQNLDQPMEWKFPVRRGVFVTVTLSGSYTEEDSKAMADHVMTIQKSF